MTRRRDSGQAAVEVALSVPLLCLMLAMIVQVALLGVHRLTLELVAREAARAASVSDDPRSAAFGIVRHADSPGPLHVEVAIERGSFVTVTLLLVDPTDVPLVGVLLPDIELTSHVTMALEPVTRDPAPPEDDGHGSPPADSVPDDAPDSP